MSRVKKKRTGGQPVIWLDVPRRSEKLADPDSYESRKRKNLDKKKKVKSVYDKHQDDQNQENAVLNSVKPVLLIKSAS
ncbi:hypothetical protein [Aliamphritea spongicola]|nr:hypothetical protein [Aliamphritea spongicola]